MRVYFAGSITGGREDADRYKEIIAHIANAHDVLTEHIGNEKAVNQDAHRTPKEVHDRDCGWLFSADAIIAEVTVPSLGVGYEIGRAIERSIPVLCLFRPGARRLSFMIKGSPDVAVVEYQEPQEAIEAIDVFLA